MFMSNLQPTWVGCCYWVGGLTMFGLIEYIIMCEEREGIDGVRLPNIIIPSQLISSQFSNSNVPTLR